MITGSWRLYRTLLVAADAAGIVVTYVLADVLRTRLWMGTAWPEQMPGVDHHFPVHFWMLAVLPLVWPVVLAWHEWYQPRWRSWWWLMRRAVSSTAFLTLLIAALALAFQRERYPRAQLGFIAVLLPATTILARSISGLIGQWLSARQPRHVLVVGADREAVRVRRLLRSIALGRPVVVGHLRLPENWQPRAASADGWEAEASPRDGEALAEPGPPASIQNTVAPANSRCAQAIGPCHNTIGPCHKPEQTGAILGGIERLGEILEQRIVDEVVFAVPLEQLPRVLPYVAQCEEVGVTAATLAQSGLNHSTPAVVNFHGLPFMTFGRARHAPELLFVKRVLDVAVALLLLLVMWPLLLICAMLIKIFSPGPVLFQQVRSGLNGRPFRMLKFRTMQVGAESRRDDVSHLNESDGPVFKSRQDPRITRIGAFLRKYSLDELPQLWNVLRGDMAVVGPRPPLPEEVEKYDRWQRRRLSMRPGLTCLWQIKGRHQVGFEEWMQLDLFYIDHWSLKLDLLIVCKTVVAVLSGSGA